MDQILQMILEIVREQQRDAADLRDTMTKAEVVELTMSMMEQQGVDEYHEDLEADIYKRIQYLAPRLFQHEDEPAEPEIHMEKFSYHMKPTEEALLNNENLNLDHMIGDELRKLSSTTIDTPILDYNQTDNHEDSFSLSESEESSDSSTTDSSDSTADLNSESIPEQLPSMNAQLNETFQDVLGQDILNQSPVDEETLNQLVMAKYMELANSGADNLQIDSASLASLVMQALKNNSTEETDKETIEDNEEIDHLLKEIWEGESKTEESNISADILPKQDSSYDESSIEQQNIEKNIKPQENISPKQKANFSALSSEKNSILSSIYNAKTYMVDFTNYLESLQKEQSVLTGFSSIDRILETGLHKGLYLINSDFADTSSFCLQLADQMASSGLPICYFLFHHSKYECMTKTLSRLTLELRGKEEAIPLSSLYKRQENINLTSLQTELKYYEENIASNLYFLENTWKDIDTLYYDIEILVHHFEQTIGKRPIILLDNPSLCKEQQDLISKLENLCSDLEIILITSMNNQTLPTIEENTYSCLDIELADLPEQDSFTKREIILEAGNSILLDIKFTDGFSKQKKKCQLFNTPKFYYFKSR